MTKTALVTTIIVAVLTCSVHVHLMFCIAIARCVIEPKASNAKGASEWSMKSQQHMPGHIELSDIKFSFIVIKP